MYVYTYVRMYVQSVFMYYGNMYCICAYVDLVDCVCRVEGSYMYILYIVILKAHCLYVLDCGRM